MGQCVGWVGQGETQPYPAVNTMASRNAFEQFNLSKNIKKAV